jgi:hypothetical protein
MTNEKPNNNSNWINKLDELKSIHGGAFNKEASWNKLHERLYSKSNKRKVIWYWLAAACLFFALFISLLMSHKKENVLVNNGIRTNKSNSPLVQNMPAINKDTTSIISSLSSKNELPGKSVHEINKTKASKHPNIIGSEIVQNKTEVGITQQLTNSAVTPVDTVISLVANVPVKKKLIVVHVNELGDPVAESPNIARNNEQHSFQFKFMNQEVYTRSSPTVAKTGFKIFTTKNLTN